MSAITGGGERRTISFSASAASRSGTAGRTISQPASFSLAICSRVALTSRVSVLVMVWTAIGAAPPMTTSPTRTGTEYRRLLSVSIVTVRSRGTGGECSAGGGSGRGGGQAPGARPGGPPAAALPLGGGPPPRPALPQDPQQP